MFLSCGHADSQARTVYTELVVAVMFAFESICLLSCGHVDSQTHGHCAVLVVLFDSP